MVANGVEDWGGRDWELWISRWQIIIYTMEYDSAILFLNEVMLFAAIWMDLEIIIVSEVSQRKINIL